MTSAEIKTTQTHREQQAGGVLWNKASTEKIFTFFSDFLTIPYVFLYFLHPESN